MIVDIKISGPERRTIRGVSDPVITIGREANNVIMLRNSAVSRRHAVVEIDDGGFWISNLSTNGTLVDGRRVRGKVAFDPGTQVQVATYVLRFFQDGTVADKTEAEPTDAGERPVDPHQSTEHDQRAVDEGKIQGLGTPLKEDPKINAIRRKIHRMLLDRLDLAAMRSSDLQDERLRRRVIAELDQIIAELGNALPPGAHPVRLKKELADEALGLGPLEDLISNDKISEIMVVDRTTIFAETAGRLQRVPIFFTSDESLRAAIERIVTPLGRRIDESVPLVDARLKDGSRVNAIIPPLAIRGAALTIRKFMKDKLQVQDLIGFGSLDAPMARFLERSVIARRNVVVAGGTGSGKTTLLNILSSSIPSNERIITIEDSAELNLNQPHVVSLETRPPNVEGKGEFTIRDLVKNSLRMRPDRIVVGECRGGEALDMLQAMNTGHDGSLTTVHANTPTETIGRLETLCLMAGLDLPSRAIRDQIASAVQLIVQTARLSDGARKVTHISELTGIDQDGTVGVRDIFRFVRTGTGANGEVEGEFRATGYLPSYLGEFIKLGLVKDGQYL